MSNSAIQSQPVEVDPVIVPGSLRNKIINGQFDIWQRGPGTFDETAISVNGKYTADRWVFGGSDAGGVRTSAIDRRTFDEGQTDVPDNPTFYLDYQNVVAGGNINVSSVIIQRMEDVRLLSDGLATLSFWAKADTAGPHTIAIHFRQFFGSLGGDPSNVLPGQEITLTDVWTQYILVFTIPNISGATLGSAGDDGLRLRFVTQAGSGTAIAFNLPNPVNFTGVLSLANVQLEDENPSPEFEDRPRALELSLCERFYEIAHREESTHGVSNAGFQIDHMWMNFKVEKREIPSIVFLPRTDPPTSSHVTPGTFLVSNVRTDGFRFDWDTVAAPQDVNVQTTDGTVPGNTPNGPWTADAEL